MMFGWMTRSHRRSARPAFSPRRARLSVEALEDRFCLSAPQVTLTAVTELANRQVQVSGTVTDDSSLSVTLGFGGVISGHETVNSNGNFTFTATASGLGQICAGGMDTLNQMSNTAQINFTSAAPTVTNLGYTWGANKQVTITGTVNDALPRGLTVNVGGPAFGGGFAGNTTTGSQGNFSITLTASQLDQVMVSTTDQWGQNSALASLKLADSTPTITNFTGTQGLGHSWTFTGTVTAGYAPGLTVNFAGLPEMANQKVTVQADGTFSLTVTLNANESGYVSCAVTDCWNLTSATRCYFVIAG
jgi:hypothetical protein